MVLGRFNPAIFQPEWFRKHELLPGDEIDAATRPDESRGLIVTQEVAQIPFRSIRLQVTRDQWGLSTDRPDWSRDLAGIAGSVFALLAETPIRVVGLNIIEHRPPATTLDEVLSSWAPLRELGEVVGTNPRFGATVRSDWEEFRVMVQVDPSEPRPGWLYLLQNYEAKVSSVADLTRILGRWQAVLDRAKLVGATLSKARVP